MIDALRPYRLPKGILTGVFFLIALFAAVLQVKEAPAGQKPYFTDLGQFNYANFLMDDGEFRLAAREYGRLIENFPSSSLIPEAQFRMAESYLHDGRYRDAAAEFKLFISNFDDSPFAPVAEVKLREARDKLRAGFPVPLPEIYRELRPGMRAVQVMLFEGSTFAGVEQEIKRLKEAGIDTIILRVFHNKGDRYYPVARQGEKRGVYFRTTHAPVVDDILPRVIEIAHNNGLKVFAWMTTRYADYGVEDNGSVACRAYGMQGEGFSRCKGLDLFNEEAVRRLEALYSDLASNEIDGVLFQDDLVLRHNEGFGPGMEALFKRDTGYSVSPADLYVNVPGKPSVHYTQLFWRWASWKNRRLLEVADRLKSAVRQKRPEAKFAINLMYESVTNPPYALAWLSQNLEAAIRDGFDYYSIMAYHRQIGAELEKDSAEVKLIISRMADEASKTVGDPHKVLIKLQTIDWKTGAPLSDGEVVELIRDIKGKGDFSLAIVPYRGGFPFHELSKAKLAYLGE